MKLLFYISSIQGGGAEKVMAFLVNRLSANGHEVYLATKTFKGFDYGVNDEVKLLQLYPCNYNFYPCFLRIPWLYLNIRKIAKSINPDVIISFIDLFNARVLLATRGLRIPVIVSERTSYERKVSLLRNFCRLYIDRLADKVVVLSKSDYLYLENKINDRIVIPNPLTIPVYSGNMKRSKTVLAVGRLDAWYVKGFDILIDIWEKIAANYPEWSLEIVGRGRMDSISFLQNLINKKNLAESIHLVGYSSSVDTIMQKSSVFILPSRNEGFPNVLLEAMSQGCACIAFDCKTGPSEMITNGVNGFLIADGQINQMIEALCILLDNLHLRKRFSVEAKKSVRRFSPENIIRQWESLFENTLYKM